MKPYYQESGITIYRSTRRKRAPLSCDACLGDAGKRHTCVDAMGRRISEES
jgi:hypothetical protein